MVSGSGSGTEIIRFYFRALSTSAEQFVALVADWKVSQYVFPLMWVFRWTSYRMYANHIL